MHSNIFISTCESSVWSSLFDSCRLPEEPVVCVNSECGSLSTQAQVKVGAPICHCGSWWPGKVESAWVKQLLDLPDLLFIWRMVTESDEGCVGDAEDVGFPNLTHRYTPSYQHQIVNTVISCKHNKASSCITNIHWDSKSFQHFI